MQHVLNKVRLPTACRIYMISTYHRTTCRSDVSLLHCSQDTVKLKRNTAAMHFNIYTVSQKRPKFIS